MNTFLIIIAIIYIVIALLALTMIIVHRKEMFDLTDEPLYKFLKFKNKFYIYSILGVIYVLLSIFWPIWLILTTIIGKECGSREIEMAK